MTLQVWFKNKKVVLEDGEVTLCAECPCECTPRVIASKVLNGESNPDWDLTSYQKEKVGKPGRKWRLREVGEAHHTNPEAPCTGINYETGDIDSKGRLIGLPKMFTSTYGYDGYMVLEEGCVLPDGTIQWTCP